MEECGDFSYHGYELYDVAKKFLKYFCHGFFTTSNGIFSATLTAMQGNHLIQDRNPICIWMQDPEIGNKLKTTGITDYAWARNLKKRPTPRLNML
jgi:hypothetical protein